MANFAAGKWEDELARDRGPGAHAALPRWLQFGTGSRVTDFGRVRGRDEGDKGTNARTAIEGELLDLFPNWSAIRPRAAATRFAPLGDDTSGGQRRNVTTSLERLRMRTAAERGARCSYTLLQINQT